MKKKKKSYKGKSNFSLLPEKQKPGETRHVSQRSNRSQTFCNVDKKVHIFGETIISSACVVLADVTFQTQQEKWDR